MFHWFRRRTAADIINEKAAEAMVLAAEHDLAAEHHSALAAMYHTRIKRLGKQAPALTHIEPELDSKPAPKKRPALSSIQPKVVA